MLNSKNILRNFVAKLTIDFETYSEAGYEFSDIGRITSGNKKGLELVGACVYSEHPTCDIISLAYSSDGIDVKIWTPDQPLPDFCIGPDTLIEAWNVGFERLIWNNVAIHKYGFPYVRMEQWRCCMAKSKAYSMPASLKTASRILDLKHCKLDGKKLIDKFTKPQRLTKKRTERRVRLSDDEDSKAFLEYNKFDVLAECEASTFLPELSKPELKFWQLDQIINERGIPIDVESLETALKLLPEIYKKYNLLISELTNGMVTTPFELKKMREFCLLQGLDTPSFKKEAVEEYLNKKDLPEKIRLLLNYRLAVNSSPVKKLPAMKAQLARDNRIHDSFSYYGAHTGRTSGLGVQVQNFPKGDSDIAERILAVLPTANDDISFFSDDPIDDLKKSLRGFVKASEGKDFICSDYSAIEAVVLACLSGEDWRVEVFRTHGMIYELSASRLLKIPFEEFVKYKKQHGKHHPARNTGKLTELAFGYGGAIGAYRNFTNDDITDNEIEKLKNAWREASPNIVKFWYDLKRCFCTALNNPRVPIKCRSITYNFNKMQDVMVCTLPSGRNIYYHTPRYIRGVLCYSGTRKGKWIDGIKLHGGILTENIVQAVSRDILMYALYNLEKAGYPIVLHVHDEILAEVPEGFGSVEEFEKTMSTLPKFCMYHDGKPWPVYAKGGWRGKRFGKH